LVETIRAEIARSGWLELLAELVRTPSHPGLPRQEEAVVEVLRRYLESRGVPCATTEVAPGRPNLLARTGGDGPGRRLILCGHTDTVPLNQGDPGVGFSAEIRDGALHGRGACDMKGALAAMAAALVALRKSQALERGEVFFAAVADEEMESLGAEGLVREGLKADGAIVGEPTSNRLALGHKGLEWLEVEFTGRAAHGGTPEAGINAVVAAARFIALAEERLQPALAARRHPLLGPPTWNVGTIAGGDQPSTVAASCRLRGDRRSVPGETFESMVAELEALLALVRERMPGLATAVRRVPGGMSTLEHLPSLAAADTPLAIAVRDAADAVRSDAGGDIAFPAWTDAALLSNFAGIPCVVLGPGDLAQAHSPREFVPLGEVEQAALIYATAALRFCS
jgi:acetylornithine deacetylase/succinyl-diaminopimelate desuccinylase